MFVFNRSMINLYTSIPSYKIKSTKQNTVSQEWRKNTAKSYNDVFVKNSSSVSFGNNLTLAEKFKPFAKELEDYVLKCEKPDFSRLESIIKKYSPTTKIKEFKELSGNSNAHDRTKAYFKQKINFTQEGEIVPDAKEIYIKFFPEMKKNEKLEFLDSLEHEFTHILQEESSDRLSKVSFLNRFIAKGGLDKEKIVTLQLMPQLFNTVEYNMSLPLYKFLGKTNNLPNPIKSASEDIINYIYRTETGYPVKSFIKNLKEQAMKNAEISAGKFDKKAVEEYIALVADKEYEAYRNTTNMLNEKCGIKGSSDLDLRVTLYDIFKKVMLR